MNHRTLEITLQYAKDLYKVNLISKMDIYAVVSISGGDKNSTQKTKTPADQDGDANPNWNFPMKFAVETAALHQNLLTLDFNLICERGLGDKEVGEVRVPVKELFDSPSMGEGKKFVTYQVRKPSGKAKGQLTFSYRAEERVTREAAPPFAAVIPMEMQTEKGAESADVEPRIVYPVVDRSLMYPAHVPAVKLVSPDRGGALPPGGYPSPCYGCPPPPEYGNPPPAFYGYLPERGYGYPPALAYRYPQRPRYWYPPAPDYGYPAPSVQ